MIKLLEIMLRIKTIELIKFIDIETIKQLLLTLLIAHVSSIIGFLSMMHAGYIGFIAKLSSAREIIVVGDSKQIPYIELSPIKIKWGEMSDFCHPSDVKLDVSIAR